MSRFITHLAYKGESLQPTLILSDQEEITPIGKTLSLSFDLSQRFCTGWHDMETGSDYPCPESAQTSKKYSTCPACQKRTGFNPAFYHATTISPQQEARNAQPHCLYLAYMGKDYIKVGISWEQRHIRRLLEQGARAGIILDTFPSALIARQYEAQIANLSNIHETTLTRVKLDLLATPFDVNIAKQQLTSAKEYIEQSLSVTFNSTDVLLFDAYYSQNTIITDDLTPLANPQISGYVEALIGDILVTQYEDRRLALPLKQYFGYPIELSDAITALDLEPQQMQLF